MWIIVNCLSDCGKLLFIFSMEDDFARICLLFGIWCLPAPQSGGLGFEIWSL
jgi:hypothetical protein